MHNETALVTSLRLNSGAGATNKVIRWGFGSSVITHFSVLAVVFFVGLKLCCLSEDSMVNAVLSAN